MRKNNDKFCNWEINKSEEWGDDGHPFYIHSSCGKDEYAFHLKLRFPRYNDLITKNIEEFKIKECLIKSFNYCPYCSKKIKYNNNLDYEEIYEDKYQTIKILIKKDCLFFDRNEYDNKEFERARKEYISKQENQGRELHTRDIEKIREMMEKPISFISIDND